MGVGFKPEGRVMTAQRAAKRNAGLGDISKTASASADDTIALFQFRLRRPRGTRDLYSPIPRTPPSASSWAVIARPSGSRPDRRHSQSQLVTVRGNLRSLASRKSCTVAPHPASASAALRYRLRSDRITHRIHRITTTSKIATTAAAVYGCCVAIQVSEIAPTSSPKLSAILENGSGEGVTAARSAVFPP